MKISLLQTQKKKTVCLPPPTVARDEDQQRRRFASSANLVFNLNKAFSLETHSEKNLWEVMSGTNPISFKKLGKSDSEMFLCFPQWPLRQKVQSNR
jgi:hypothetical protein